MKERLNTMAEIIDNARKGTPEAMRALYDQNKDRIMFLCQALLLDENADCNAVSHVFKAMWELVVSGQVISEQDFQDTVTRKAVNYCKAQIARKDSKAFRVPVSRNFMNTPYDAGKMNLSGQPWEIVLKNLPHLHRFIYVLHGVCGYDDIRIAKLFNTSTETVRLALQAEETNISRILSLVPDHGVENMTAEAFHQALLEQQKAVAIPRTVTITVHMGIDNICQPFLDKRKKQRTRRTILVVSLLVAVCLIVGISVAVGGGTAQTDPSASPSESVQVSETPEPTASTGADESGTETGDTAEAETASYYADIEIQDYGTITVALDEEAAPETVANFVSLAESGFYDGLTFHRIIEGFMMQGGDPNGDGTGGSGTTIVGEFSENGYENNLSHTRGAISMARSDDYDSASSQFFIVQEDYPSLDGKYAVFGYVTEGMDIVDAICEAAQPTDDNGTIPAEEQPVITSITIRTPEAESSGQ